MSGQIDDAGLPDDQTVRTPSGRECGCPRWCRCIHFDGAALIMADLSKAPAAHRKHLPQDIRFSVYHFGNYDGIAFEDCDVCGTARGVSSGPWTLRPEQLYKGMDEATAEAAFRQAELILFSPAVAP